MIYNSILDFLHIYAPNVYMRVKHLIVLKRRGNFNPPISLPEKLLWLGTHDYWDNPTIKLLEDKYSVRKYLSDKGYSYLLNELYFVWDDSKKINWEELPKSFVIKLNIGSGRNIICKDKQKLNISDAKIKLNKWMRRSFLHDQTMADGKGVQKVLLCEKYFGDIEGLTPIDYKFYCFHGKPTAILVIWDRFSSKKAAFMSCDWELIKDMSESRSIYNKIDGIPPKPGCLKEMIEIATDLSSEFPFVRIDLYDIKNRPVFGEFTFFPGGCAGVSETPIDGIEMGELLKI